MSVQFEDYYKILGVSRQATKAQIQKAFRQKARQYHPDINPDPAAEEQFKKINEAYEVLKDPDSRRQYDALGANWKQGQDFRPPPGWGGFGNQGGVHVDFGQGVGQGQSGFSDFFEVLFGQRTQRPHRPQNPVRDAEVDIRVPLIDVYQNQKRTVQVTVDGQSKSYRVRLPPGTTEGSLIRLAGQGPQSAGGRGDLKLRILIEPHARFEVQGFDLIYKLPLSAWEHALGIRVDVPTLDGVVQVKIPPLMPPGRKLRLKAKGLMTAQKERAHLYVMPSIVNPSSLSDEERALFEQLAAHSSFDPREP